MGVDPDKAEWSAGCGCGSRGAGDRTDSEAVVAADDNRHTRPRQVLVETVLINLQHAPDSLANISANGSDLGQISRFALSGFENFGNWHLDVTVVEYPQTERSDFFC
jgi:hypothetical protein